MCSIVVLYYALVMVTAKLIKKVTVNSSQIILLEPSMVYKLQTSIKPSRES